MTIKTEVEVRELQEQMRNVITALNALIEWKERQEAENNAVIEGNIEPARNGQIKAKKAHR
jgi:hypothetical protein